MTIDSVGDGPVVVPASAPPQDVPSLSSMPLPTASAAPSAATGSAPPGGAPHRLRGGAIGLVAVLFMALANAAPITAMTGNVPIAVGYGNGTGAPAGFLVATVVLTIFAVGYVAMAKHITATGAFYGFISHGLGRIVGMGAGLLATFSYIVFEGSLVGIFASFAKNTVTTFGGPDVSWIVYALICVVVVGLLGYFDISLSGKVLGVFLVTEVIVLSALGLGVLIGGGGPDGLLTEAVNPINAFSDAPAVGAAAAGSAGIGLFFAFWSWVGFETTAVYGEESRDPKRIVPRATMIAVVGLGLFYTFVSWMVLAWNGTDRALEVSRSTSAFDLFFDPTKDVLGTFVFHVYEILTVAGSFACALAFHNAASRYLYALGRDGVSSRLASTLGSTHPKHRSPHLASATQTAITLVIVLGFFFFQKPTEAAPDVAYFYLYGLLALIGTMAILIVQSVCSVAVIAFFATKKREAGHWWRTYTAPALGTLGMLYVIYLMLSNLEFAAGAAADSPVFTVGPWVVVGVFALGVAVAAALRARAPHRYAKIGQTLLEDTHERTDA
ncbi:MAG: APC family permease [Kineosporiaceae bacterium]